MTKRARSGPLLHKTASSTRPVFALVTIDTVDELGRVNDVLLSHDGWAFRGTRRGHLGLHTTLHRACDRHGLDYSAAADVERLVLREFARRAHLYVRDGSDLPHPDDTLEWMSLMRHYGAPTRLLDWTYSIFVAAFFALTATQAGEPASVWAADTYWLNHAASRSGAGLRRSGMDEDKSGARFRRHFMPVPPRRPKAFVATANPYRLNARLAIQHGVFLCPGDVRLTFVENIAAMRAVHRGHAYELRLSGDVSFRRALARLLDRQNINTEVLFPGLEGLGRALRDRIPALMNAGSVVRGDMSWLGRAPGRPRRDSSA